MLLVDNNQAEAGEINLFLNQSVSADDKLGIAPRDMAPSLALAIIFQRAGQ